MKAKSCPFVVTVFSWPRSCTERKELLNVIGNGFYESERNVQEIFALFSLT